MNLTSYILTSNRYKGKLILTYRDEIIYSFINDFEQLTEKQWDAILKELPFEEKNISHLNEIGLQCKQDLKTNEKIALFCRMYEKHRGRKYKVAKNGAESGKIKQVAFDEALLDYYFTSDWFDFKDKWSIHNMVKYYNELCDRYNHRNDPKHIVYSRKHEQTLTGEALSQYWKLLRASGYRPVMVGGTPINWIKDMPAALPTANPNS